MYLGYCQKWSDGSVSQHRTIGGVNQYAKAVLTIPCPCPQPVGEPWVAGFDEPTFYSLPRHQSIYKGNLNASQENY